MKERVRELMSVVSIVFELLVAVLLLVALFAALLGLVQSLSPAQLVKDPELFSEFLSLASTLVIGVEFVNMLCNHSMGVVIEIMLLAIARQMIVSHTSPLENLLAVLSVGLLYLFRKYLYIPSLDRKTARWLMKMLGIPQKPGKPVKPLDEQID
ncbi:MAG: hypothetical protein HFG45_00390 [Oscillospiraceae bacterium]|jgi:hypothetical protein|nr:hypothetical protein [Oscillospiraceae bacterium]